MSAMRSASSMTTRFTSSSRSEPRSRRSLRRPGVATTTSTPLPSALHLPVHAGAAVDGEHLGLGAPAQGLQLLLHLRGELTGRHEHEALGTARGGLLDAGEQREAEGDGLAGAGGRLAADVAAGEAVGERGGLDGEGFGDAELVEARAQVGGHAEGGEGGGHGWLSGRTEREALQGGGLKPQLDTARQRLLAPEHCTGRRAPKSTIRVRAHGTGDGAEDVADPRAVPRADLLRARGDGRLRGARGDGLRRLLRLACRADGRGAGRGRGRHLLQLQPRHRPPRHPRGVAGAPRRRRCSRRASNAASDALRRAAGDLLDDPSVPRAAELARTGRGGVHRRRASALRRARRPCRGPTSRRSRSGTPSRCCASSAATATSPASSRRASTGSTRSVFHAASGEVPRAALQGSRQWDDAVVGRVGGEPRASGASSTATAPSPRPGPPSASTSRTAPTPSPSLRGQALGEEGCDELRSLVRPLSQAIVGSGTFGLPR